MALTNRFGKLRIATVQDSVLDPVVFQDFDKYPSQQSRAIQLTAGQKYYFEVLHKQGGYSDHVSVAWQTPNAARQIIPASAFNADFTEAEDRENDGLPDSWELQVGLNPADNGLIDPRDGENADWDGDGISNLTEYQLGSNPKSDDSGRNLLATTYATLPPQNYVSTTDHWNRDASGSLTAVERRGEISYNFTVAAGDAGVYEIVLGGGAAGIPRPVEKLPLVFSINGNRIGTAVLTSLNGGTSSVALLTPWLPKGDYTLTILHDNYRTALQLRIDSLIIRTLAGSDVNANGRPDWLDQRLAADNRLTRIPATSLTSPLCIEGIAAQGVNRQGHTSSIPGLSLKVNDEPLTPKESIDSSFYANVPLSESAPTTVTASFQSGAVTESHEITWVPVNLRVHQVLHIRKDDSLRLDAWVDGATGPPKTFTVTMDGTLLADPAGNTTHTSGQPFTATFATAGTYTLVTNYSNRLPRTTVVHVHRANFGPDFSVRANAPREWFPPALSPILTVQADSRLAWQETTAVDAPRSFLVTPFDIGLRHVIARIPDDAIGAPSAIVDRGTVNAFYLAYVDETYDVQLIHTYPDGTRLMSGSIVAVGLPPDIYVRIQSIFQGTLFINGSETLWLTNADFDQNGIATLYFEWSGEGNPRMCSNVGIFTTPPAQN